jgi:prepilin-type N-terminal cleavage/methylation domain-containing protein
MSLLSHKVNGFTLAEVIVTLALTSMVITFAYGTLTYVQKLFSSYRNQNRFMQEYTCFKERMDHEALYADWMMEQGENSYRIKRDSVFIDVEFLKTVTLLKNGVICDTFHLVPENLKKMYEPIGDPLMKNKLVRSLNFDIEYSKQKFSFSFLKNYDASVKLKLEMPQ